MQSISLKGTQRVLKGGRAQRCSSSVVVRANGYGSDRKLWYPGEAAPSHLNGTLPGDYGFDPAGLGKDPGNLQRFAEAEVLHGRWAMLGALGCLFVELSGNGTWVDAPKWAIEGGSAAWFGVTNPVTLPIALGTQLFLMAAAELYRSEEKDPAKRIYPGGSFDPLGFAGNKSADELAALKTKEIKNGRLAMFAMAGFFAQSLATDKSPLTNLAEHFADPFGVNIATNGVSVPIY